MWTICQTQGLKENGPDTGGTRKMEDKLRKTKPNVSGVSLPLSYSNPVTISDPQPHEIQDKALHQRLHTNVRGSGGKGKY